LALAFATARLYDGRLEDALIHFGAAERLQASLEREHPLAMELRGWIVLVHALKGDRVATLATLAAMGADEREAAGARLADAALRLAQGAHEEALDVLTPLIEGTPKALHPRWATVHALLFDAAARDRLRDRAGAEASIERALELAEPDGVVLQFALAPVRELLERHPRHRTTHATLLDTIFGVLAGRSPPPRETASLTEENAFA
jgi:LuxR family maltose regulon positive regulatory protein